MYWRVKKSTFFLRLVVEALDVGDRVVQPARGDEVALLDVVEQEVLLPVLVLEALVALGRRGDRLAARAHQLASSTTATGSCSPTTGSSAPRRAGTGSPASCDGELHERLADAEFVGDASTCRTRPGGRRSRPSAWRSSRRRRRATRRARSDRRPAWRELRAAAVLAGVDMAGFLVRGRETTVTVLGAARSGWRRRRRRGASSRPACQRWFRWAIASPIAKNRCCRSSSRRNSTGTQVGGADRCRRAARDRRGELVEARGVVRAQLRRRGAAMPRNGSPCDGSTSVSAGSASNAASESRKRRQRVAVGLDRPDADVGADPRQQHVAGDQHAALRREYSDACSGEWPWPSITRHARPPAATSLAVEHAGRTWPAARARRGGSGCRGRRAPARCSAGHARGARTARRSSAWP